MTRWLLLTASASALVASLLACSSGTTLGTTGDGGTGGDGGSGDDGGTIARPIAAKDFNQTCTKADDCTLVTEGDVCAICSCSSAAIAKTDLDAYNAKRSELSAECGPRPAIGCGVDCAAFQVTCSAAGKCAASLMTGVPDAGHGDGG